MNFLLLLFAYVAKGKIILVSPEYVACIYAFFYIVENGVVTVGYDGLRLLLKNSKVVHHKAAEECAAVLQRGFVYYHSGSFGLYAFHYALNGGVAEVVAAALHCEAVNAYGWELRVES